MPYTLNLYSAAYQLYFNKNEKKNPPKQVRGYLKNSWFFLKINNNNNNNKEHKHQWLTNCH